MARKILLHRLFPCLALSSLLILLSGELSFRSSEMESKEQSSIVHRYLSVKGGRGNNHYAAASAALTTVTDDKTTPRASGTSTPLKKKGGDSITASGRSNAIGEDESPTTLVQRHNAVESYRLDSTTAPKQKPRNSKPDHNPTSPGVVARKASSTNEAEVAAATKTKEPLAFFLNVWIPHLGSRVKAKGTRVSLDNSIAIMVEQIHDIGVNLNNETEATIYVMVVGDRSEPNLHRVNFRGRHAVKDAGPNIRYELLPYTERGQDTNGETQTLQALQSYCQAQPPTESGSRRVVYLHNKGSFNPTQENTNWRKSLTAAVTHPDCLYPPSTSSEQQCNVCGLQFAAPPQMFTLLFPGNFFSASCEYVNKLVPPMDFSQQLQKVSNYAIHGPLKLSSTKKDWELGRGRYASEHWIGSHPELRPCDLSPEPDYWFWQKKQHQDSPASALFQWSEWPRRLPQHLLNGDEQEDETAAAAAARRYLLEYTLLPGRLVQWSRLYNGQVPPPSSWVWKWFPDSQFWQTKLTEHNGNAEEAVKAVVVAGSKEKILSSAKTKV